MLLYLVHGYVVLVLFAIGSLFSATECVLTATKLLGVLLARGVDCFIAVQTAFEETFHSDRLNPEIRSVCESIISKTMDIV